MTPQEIDNWVEETVKSKLREINKIMNKTYLGDGVYVRVYEQNVILTTEDGIKVTNEIYLEPDVCASLLRFISTYKVEE